MIYNTIWWTFKGSSVGSCRGAFLGEAIQWWGLGLQWKHSPAEVEPLWAPTMCLVVLRITKHHWCFLVLSWVSAFIKKVFYFFASVFMMWEKWSQMWQCRLKNPTERAQVDLTFILWLILSLTCQFILFERPNWITCNIFILPFQMWNCLLWCTSDRMLLWIWANLVLFSYSDFS